MTLLDGNDSTPAMNLPHASDATDETVVFSPIKRRWPVKDEYDLAIANWHSTVFDPEIRTGQLARDNHGIYTYGGANLYICIYRVSDWMVRFFCTNPNHPTPSDIQERYKAIARFCNSHTLSCLLPIKYVERGILVGGNREFPLIKMPFLENCPPLGEFIINNYQESEVMHRLCDAWVGMMYELEDAQIAHGDLDLTNVLVQEQDQQITLKLIDYDNMWIPALRGRSQTEYGHSHFQHPAFMQPNQRPYTQEMDRFSALSIYISLRTIAEYPALYDEYGADEDDRLLFSEQDYKNAGLVGSRLQQLRDLNIPDLVPYLDELDSALKAKRMPCALDDISTYKMHAIRPKYQAQSLTPSTSLWNQATYNATFMSPSPPNVSVPFKQITSPIPAVDYRALMSQQLPTPEARRVQGTLFTIKRSTSPIKKSIQTQQDTLRESLRPEVPSWLLITLIVACVLLLIAVIFIFILILQRQAVHIPFTEHSINTHRYYVHALAIMKRDR